MTNIGDTVQGSDLSVPIGTSITCRGEVFTREVDGWHARNGRRHVTHPLTWGGAGPVTAMVPFTETLAMHKQRFAVTCLTMGHMSGGGGYLEGARAIVSNLGLEDPVSQRLRIGSWVSYHVNRGVTPTGTVLLSGARNRAEGHSLFTTGHRRFTHLSGPRDSADGLLLQVVGLPSDYETEPWPEPTEDDEEAIRLFRIRAWEVGYDAKVGRSWCSDFESAISVLSLSEEMAHALRRQGGASAPAVGMQCSAALMDLAPVGTIASEGPGSFTVTKMADGWHAWNTGEWCDASSLYFHPGLTFTHIGEQPVEQAAGPRFAYGTPVDNAQQRSCALGAVFAYADNADRYLWGRTDEGGYNGTRGLGASHAHWSSIDTTVVWDGVSPIHEVPVRDHREMEMMPVGTVIGQQWDGTRFPLTWTKRGDGRWDIRRARGVEGQSDGSTLGTSPLRYAYIPVPGVPRPANAPVLDDDDLF